MIDYRNISVASVVLTIAAVVIVASAGGYFSMMNREWFMALNKPTWQPPDLVFPIVWNIIYIISIVAIILIWNTEPRTLRAYSIVGLLILNGLLHVGWSFLFFGNQAVLSAAYNSGLLFFTVVGIMILSWPITRLGTLLFLPYALWTAFATYLTWTIYQLN